MLPRHNEASHLKQVAVIVAGILGSSCLLMGASYSATYLVPDYFHGTGVVILAMTVATILIVFPAILVMWARR
jgi:hypothetical protein